MTLSLILQMLGIGFLVGLAKTSIGGLGLLSTALLAQILPAKESTAVLLVLLIIGDIFAIGVYRKYVNWSFLKSLITPVIVGLIIGALFLWKSTDDSLRIVIGWIVLVLVILYPVMQFWQKNHTNINVNYPNSVRNILGTTAGFMSMIANAGGTPMSIYLFLRRENVLNLLANTAWFFFIVNLTKIPFVLGLGLMNFKSVEYIILAFPAIAFGASLGKKIVSRINQKIFQELTLISAGLLGVNLIVS